MAKKISIEIPEDRLAFFQRVLAMSEELEELAQQAPYGTVFDTCETAAVERGREIVQQLLEQSVASRIETAEKKTT